MAKEFEQNGLSVKMKFALWVIGLVFAGGMTYNTITAQGKKIEVNTKDIKTVNNDVHRIELDSKDVKSIAIKAAEAMISIDTKLTSIQIEQGKQATIQAVNSEKLKTLTKE